ncbi:hypothetical protein [Streptococcus pasteurianus]|uniref:hypothetical protein n=1 Tax=Streptococcus pasteurianus TaxID=197614 RepID=UPI001F29B3D5|nr:hypothetical protein [Streptococcus pasteurianus]
MNDFTKIQSEKMLQLLSVNWGPQISTIQTNALGKRVHGSATSIDFCVSFGIIMLIMTTHQARVSDLLAVQQTNFMTVSTLINYAKRIAQLMLAVLVIILSEKDYPLNNLFAANGASYQSQEIPNALNYINIEANTNKYGFV